MCADQKQHPIRVNSIIMKTNKHPVNHPAIWNGPIKKLSWGLALLGLFAFCGTNHAANVFKANNADNLNLGTSWTGGVPPTSGDVAVWDSTVGAANSVVLGASTNWAGIKESSVGGAVTVNPNVLGLPFSTVSGSAMLTYSNGAPANPLVNGDQVFIGVTNVGFNTGLPNVYYVVNAAATTFQLSATPGGAAINATKTQASPMVLPTVTGGFLTLGTAGIDTSLTSWPLTLNCPVVAGAPQNWNLFLALTTVSNLFGANVSGNDVTVTAGTLNVGNLTLSNLVVNPGATVLMYGNGPGIIALNGGTFYMQPNVTYSEGVYVTPSIGGYIKISNSRTWGGNLTGTGPLTLQLRGNYMNWNGNNSGYSGTIALTTWDVSPNNTGGLRLNNTNTVNANTAYTMDSAALAYMVFSAPGTYNLGSLSGGGLNALDTSGYIGTAGGIDDPIGTNDYCIGALNTSTSYSGNIQGGGGIIKVGTGRLTLDGKVTAKTYTGHTVISNGVLQVGSGGASGMLGSGSVTNLSQLVFNISGSQTFANVIAGTGNVTNIGSGTVNLTGANNYSGSTVITAGELGIGSASLVASAITVGNGATLGAVPATASATVTEGAVNFGSGCSYDFNLGTLPNPTSTSVVSNTGSINLNGNITVNLTGTNTSLTSGTITLLRYASRSGTGSFVLGSLPFNITASGLGLVDDPVNKEVRLTINIPPLNDVTRVWVGNAIGNWDIGNTGNKIWKVRGTGQLTNYNEGDAVLFDDTATGTTNINLTTTLNPSAVTVTNNSKTYTFGGSGSLAGSTGLKKQGTGTLITTNANSYGGMTAIEGGTLKVAGRNASLGSGGVTNNGTLVLDLSTAGASYTLPFYGQITGAGSVTILGMDPNNSIVQMNIADAIGAGVAGNPYGGGTTLSNVDVQLVPNPYDPVTAVAAKSTGLGTNTITFLGASSVEEPDLGLQTSSSYAGDFTAPIYVPVGQSGTLNTAGRTTVSGPVTGGGTFNLGISWVRDDINCNFSAFTGQINIFPNASADFRIDNTNGFPLASLYLEANVTAYSQAGSGTVFKIGEFSSDPASVIGEGTTATATGTPCTWQVGALNLNSTNAGNIGGGIGEVSLIKEGTGTWTLSGVDTYSGSTTISNGVLALIGDTGVSNSPTISISSPGVLDVSGRNDGTLSLGTDITSQTLQGNGTIRGSLVVGSLGTVTPGFSVGTLTVTNAVTLGGAAVFELDRAGSPNSDRIVAKLFTGGGTLAVTNIGAGLQAGDTFQLFSTNISGFAAVNLQTNDAANYKAYTWTNRLAIDGTIRVLTAVLTVNTNRPIIGCAVSGNTLTLSWPTNAGWTLEVQTNSSSTGLSTNWVAVPNSQNVTSTNITINPTNGSVFYRMVLP
jgi:fibronectin-binding autotransporter adhesin